LAAVATSASAAAQQHQQPQGVFPPFFGRNFTQIVQWWGYPCEEHRAQTADGYILTLFRIPPKHGGGLKRPPVLLQHGLLDSSFTWIVNQPFQSLPYILHDAGFDVWMGNNRGNIYSLEHVYLDPTDPLFWDFSWDEMAQYDLPAMLDYILSVTNYPKMAYVGHSQGTIQMFGALASGPPLPLNSFIGLGPVAFVTNEENLPLRLLADTYFDKIVELFGLRDFLPKVNNATNPLLEKLFLTFCTECEYCCDNVIELLCGEHQGAFNDSLMPWLVTNEPGGTSVKNIEHWAQGIRSGQFAMFDYGWWGNIQHYGQITPPQYDLGSIPTNIPLAMYTGGKDLLADPIDVSTLLSQLPAGGFWLNVPDYAHIDFVWAIDAYKTIYPSIVKQLLESDV
jgi:pimeloyl-ACP methyl ester carboxylesterase